MNLDTVTGIYEDPAKDRDAPVEAGRAVDPLAERIRETLVAVRDIAPDCLIDGKVEVVAGLVAKGVRDLGRHY